jgi:hypothetical protein
MISVITPTIRKEGLDIVAKALQKQTWTDWEWLIGSPFDPEIPWATWVKDDFKGGFWTLNRMYNRLFQEAKGELIVSWQDFIYATPGGLEQFWDAYLELGGKGLISGVGDQYKSIDAFGKPYNKIWNDPRKNSEPNKGTFYECYWNDIEWNWAAIPRVRFFDVGGMDEQLDFLGYGGDQLQTCDRLSDLGWVTFWLDKGNESYTLRHSRDDHGGQEHWDANHVLFNGKYVERKNQLIKAGQWPKLIDNGNNVLLDKERKEE